MDTDIISHQFIISFKPTQFHNAMKIIILSEKLPD